MQCSIRILALLAVSLISWPTLSVAAVSPTCLGSDPSVTTANGKLCGSVIQSTSQPTQSINLYQGIPYAQPPIGKLRWANPVPVANWSGVKPAKQFGNICWQPQLSKGQQQSTGNEDCLYLNVWTPANAGNSKLPVMVFIHGGAFIIGSGSGYDGSNLAAGNVVVVTLNYRLGALGFLAVRRLGINGNFGLLDQRLAMQWVKTNIAAFGGDPDKITLFGESAGAMSVGLHMFSAPDSAKLFNAAIMESNPMGIVYLDTPDLIDGRWSGYIGGNGYQGDLCTALKKLPICTLSKKDLLKISPNNIMSAQAAYSGKLRSIGRIGTQGWPVVLPWTPIVDGAVVKNQPFNGSTTKPYMFGVNRNEAVLFVSAIGGEMGNKVTSGSEAAIIPTGEMILGFGAYDALMAKLFGVFGAAEIISNRFYDPLFTQKYDYFNNNTSLSATNNVFNDMTFRCANLIAADRNLASNGGKANVYGYLFTETPQQGFDLAFLKNSAACSVPQNANVCHTVELPFVFNTPTEAYSGGAPQQVQTVAQQMSKQWLNFATHFKPDNSWPAYSSSSHQLQTFGSGAAPGDVYSASNCALWSKQMPFNK